MAKRSPLRAHPADPQNLLWLSEILGKPWKIMWFNFIAGVSRGLGFALGFTVLAGAVVAVAVRIATHAIDIPLIGSHIAAFIADVQRQAANIRPVRP